LHQAGTWRYRGALLLRTIRSGWSRRHACLPLRSDVMSSPRPGPRNGARAPSRMPSALVLFGSAEIVCYNASSRGWLRRTQSAIDSCWACSGLARSSGLGQPMCGLREPSLPSGALAGANSCDRTRSAHRRPNETLELVILSTSQAQHKLRKESIQDCDNDGLSGAETVDSGYVCGVGDTNKRLVGGRFQWKERGGERTSGSN